MFRVIVFRASTRRTRIPNGPDLAQVGPMSDEEVNGMDLVGSRFRGFLVSLNLGFSVLFPACVSIMIGGQ